MKKLDLHGIDVMETYTNLSLFLQSDPSALLLKE
jgi:hypothetical protein